MASESSDVSLRFQQVTRQSAEQHEEQAFLHLNVEELDHHKIDFGKEKKGQTYLKVVQEDPQPRYTALFTSTYKNSTKGPHRKFIHYVSLYTDRLEQQLAEEKTPETQPKNQPKSRRPIMTSPREWQDRTPSSSPSPSQKSSHWEMIREADQSDRGSAQPDCATAGVCHQPSQPDRPVGLPTESQAECLTLGSHQRVQLHDTLGKEHVQQPRNQTVLDPQYFHDLLMKEEIVPNEIFREMHVYWGKRFGIPDPQEQRRHFNHKGIDLLEVYCSSDSQLTMQANLGGLVASRFGLKHGDLGTFAGRCALYVNDQI